MVASIYLRPEKCRRRLPNPKISSSTSLFIDFNSNGCLSPSNSSALRSHPLKQISVRTSWVSSGRFPRLSPRSRFSRYRPPTFTIHFCSNKDVFLCRSNTYGFRLPRNLNKYPHTSIVLVPPEIIGKEFGANYLPLIFSASKRAPLGTRVSHRQYVLPVFGFLVRLSDIQQDSWPLPPMPTLPSSPSNLTLGLFLKSRPLAEASLNGGAGLLMG